MRIIDRIKHSIRVYYILYADSSELLDKAQKLLRPLPQGCKLVKLTYENMNLFKTKDLVDKMLQLGDGGVWAIVNNNDEIIAWQYGTCRGKNSMFFKVKNCDYEHVEILVDEKYRRNGLAIYLLYCAVKNLNFADKNNKKIGTCIRPYNTPSLMLHELIGFKKSHKVVFIHKTCNKNGRYSFINIPHHSI